MIPARRPTDAPKPGRIPVLGCPFFLALVVCLVGGSRIAATNWGFMWEPPADPALQSNVLARASGVAGAGVRMVRINPEVPLPRSFVFWPGARPLPRPQPADPLRFALSADVSEVYWDCRTRDFGGDGQVRTFEIGNEPDLHFTSDLPDRMAATLKAAYWGIRARGDASVLMPSLCSRPGPYAELLVANGIGPFTEAWNVHFYGWAHDLGDTLAAHRQFLRAHGLADLPVYVTEFGFAEFDATAVHLEALQARRQMTFFERSAAELVASDVAAAWAFCLQPYTESGMDLGLHDAGWNPRPALQRWSAMAQRLKDVAPRYRLRDRNSGGIAGYAFERIGPPMPARWWVLLCSPHRRADFDLPPLPGAGGPRQAPETSIHVFDVQLGSTVHAILGIDGELGEWTSGRLAFESSAATNLHLHVDRVPFRIDGCDWERLEAPARRTNRRASPSPVIVELLPDPAVAWPEKNASAYRFDSVEPVPLDVRLSNWGAVVQHGRLALELPKGWEMADGSGSTWSEVVSPFRLVTRRRLIRRTAAGGEWDRAEIGVRWKGNESVDSARVRFAPAIEPHLADVALVSGWLPGDRTSKWRIETATNGVTCRLEAGSRSGTPTLLLPLDVRLKPESVLRLNLRWETTARDPDTGPCRVRIELVTSDREVFRWGEETPLRAAVVRLACRVGDFTPAFWSRVMRNEPSQGRFVRLSFPAMREGESVRFEAETTAL